MADNQEDNDKSNSIKNDYEENSDKIEAALGGNLKVHKDDEVEMIKEADQFPKLDDQKDFSVAVDLMKSLKELPVKDWQGRRSKLTAEDRQIYGSVDPVKLARLLLKRMDNIDESEPANSISKAKTHDTNPFYKSGHRKTDRHSVESRSNGMILEQSASKLASESDSKSNFKGVIIKKKNIMESIQPRDSAFLQNGSPVTPKHPKPVPDSGTEPQLKKYRCSICGSPFQLSKQWVVIKATTEKSRISHGKNLHR